MSTVLAGWLVMVPVILPLAAGGVTLLLRQHTHWQRRVSLWASVGLAAAGFLLLSYVLRGDAPMIVVHMGSWKAPYGISFVADKLSAIMVAITGLIACMVSWYASYREAPDGFARQLVISETMETRGYHSIYHFLLAALCGAFLTGDLFNLYVWFEVLLICSFVLLSLDNQAFRLRGALAYVLLNLLASALFLLATGLLYRLTGTLNMADLSLSLASVHPQQPLSTVIAVLFLLAFGMKAAVFPLFYWLPAAYHTPPPPLGALFAALLTKVGVYALLRMFSLIFIHDIAYTHTLLLGFAALTIISGVLAALVQEDIRKILGFHLIAQVGFMLLGLGMMGQLGLRATVFYFLEDIIVIANLYLLVGLLARAQGSFKLQEMAGIYGRYGWLSIAFILSALSIAGIPPLSGFWAKVMLLQSALDGTRYLIVALIVVGAIGSLLSMARVWMVAFWRTPAPIRQDEAPRPAFTFDSTTRRMVAPIVLLSSLSLAIGLYPEPLVRLADATAHDLLRPSQYHAAVLQLDKADSVYPEDAYPEDAHPLEGATSHE